MLRSMFPRMQLRCSFYHSFFLFSWPLALQCYLLWMFSVEFDFSCFPSKNAVTGEHTCMILKPLHSEDIEVNESDEWGFFGPFYRGEATFDNDVFFVCIFFFSRLVSSVPSFIFCFLPLDFKQRFFWLLVQHKLQRMDYKLLMRLGLYLYPLQISFGCEVFSFQS